MTELSEQILQDWQIRKSKKQKLAFIEFLKQQLSVKGITVTIEKKGISRNLVIGDPDTADVIYTAHYDTPAVMPFPNMITPRNFFAFLLYQLALTVLLIAPGVVFEVLIIRATDDFSLGFAVFYLWLVGALYLLMAGPANKHNANDNTSGVITVLETMLMMSEEQRSRSAFVLFDNEEKGLLGSAAFAAKHKKELKGVVVNYDCVADGDDILLIPSRAVKKDGVLLDAIDSSYTGNIDKTVSLVRKGFVVYPSDQGSFKRSVGVAAFRTSRLFGLYLERIHTGRDTVFDRDNITLLAQGGVQLLCTVQAAR